MQTVGWASAHAGDAGPRSSCLGGQSHGATYGVILPIPSSGCNDVELLDLKPSGSTKLVRGLLIQVLDLLRGQGLVIDPNVVHAALVGLIGPTAANA